MARGTNGTPKKRTARDWSPRFLERLRRHGNITEACEAAGVGRTTFYRRRDEDADFAAATAEALENAADGLEKEAYERALAGSDVLLIFMLKALRPGKFRETLRHQIGADPDAPPLPLFVEVPVGEPCPAPDRLN